MLEELGAVPSYYLRYFYAHDQVPADQLGGATPRAATVAEIERELLELYADPTLSTKPALLERRGGAYYSEAAIRLVASLSGHDDAVHEVDVRNHGTLAGLADDDVVEVPACVDASGAHPLEQRPLAPELLGLVQHTAAYAFCVGEIAGNETKLIARADARHPPAIGERVALQVAPDEVVHLFDAGSGERLSA